MYSANYLYFNDSFTRYPYDFYVFYGDLVRFGFLISYFVFFIDLFRIIYSYSVSLFKKNYMRYSSNN